MKLSDEDMEKLCDMLEGVYAHEEPMRKSSAQAMR